jgi:hypothetical protein
MLLEAVGCVKYQEGKNEICNSFDTLPHSSQPVEVTLINCT